MTVIGLFVPFFVPVTPPLPDVHVTVYPVMGEPFGAGATNVAFNEPGAGLVTVGAGGVPGDGQERRAGERRAGV